MGVVRVVGCRPLYSQLAPNPLRGQETLPMTPSTAGSVPEVQGDGQAPGGGVASCPLSPLSDACPSRGCQHHCSHHVLPLLTHMIFSTSNRSWKVTEAGSWSGGCHVCCCTAGAWNVEVTMLTPSTAGSLVTLGLSLVLSGTQQHCERGPWSHNLGSALGSNTC